MSIRILQGDNRATLAGEPAGRYHCVITSPPYWGLRSYLPNEDYTGIARQRFAETAPLLLNTEVA